MSYTFVKITSYYRDYLKQYYGKNPQLSLQTYAEQHRHLMDQAYGWSDFYARHLRNLGVDAHEIVANAELLQHTWGKEHGIRGDGKSIVLEQLKAMKPDVVFFQDSFLFNGEWVRRLKEQIPSIKLIIGWCCTNYAKEHVEAFRPFDFFFVCSPLYTEEFRRHGLKTFQIFHGFEESLLPKLSVDNPFPEVDFIFLGSIVPGARGHNLRRDVLVKLVESGIDLEMYAHFLSVPSTALFLRRCAYIVAKSLATVGLSSFARSLPLIQKAYYLEEMPDNPKHIEKLKRQAKPPVYGLEMFRALSRSKIGFNYHGEGAGEYAANVRLFEVTGAGSCMITDWKKNLHEMFEEDSEVVTFTSAEECIEKVRWLLRHPKERAEIALRGQRRVLKDHTYRRRAEQVHSIILHNIQ